MIVEQLSAELMDRSTLEEVRSLLPHLTAQPVPIERTLGLALTDPAITILVAREQPGTQLLGMITLVLFTALTGRRARIEDLVVDPSRRGRGIGEALVEAAVARARQAQAVAIDLTSNPNRTAAVRLYLRMGFVPWNTNVYRLPIELASQSSATSPASEA